MSRFALNLAGHGLVPGSAPISFRSSATTSASTSIAKPSGVAAGDVCVMLASGGGAGTTMSIVGGGDAWSVDEETVSSSVVQLFWRIMNATDISELWNTNNAVTALVAAYTPTYPVSSVSLRSHTVNANGLSSLVLTGFTPGFGSKGVISCLMDRDGNTASDTPPSGWTADATVVLGPFQGVAANPSNLYQGGDLTWTAVNGGSSFGEGGWLLELT